MQSRRKSRAHGASLKAKGGGFMPSECTHALKVSRGSMGNYGRLKGGA